MCSGLLRTLLFPTGMSFFLHLSSYSLTHHDSSETAGLGPAHILHHLQLPAVALKTGVEFQTEAAAGEATAVLLVEEAQTAGLDPRPPETGLLLPHAPIPQSPATPLALVPGRMVDTSSAVAICAWRRSCSAMPTTRPS